MSKFSDFKVSLSLFSIRHPVLSKILLVVLCVALLSSAVIIAVVIKDSQRYEFVMTPEAAKALYNADNIEDFVEQQRSTITSDIKISINNSGNAITSYSKEAYDVAVERYKSDVKVVRNYGVHISEDYRDITVDANLPLYFFDNRRGCTPWALWECIMLQYLSGVPSDELSVHFTAIDYNTGETVYEASFPEQNIYFWYYVEEGYEFLTSTGEVISEPGYYIYEFTNQGYRVSYP